MDATGSFSKGRRSLLKTALAGAASSLLPAFTPSARAAEQLDGAFKVGTYGGSWRDNLDKFVGQPVAARGANVGYVIDSPTGNLAKLIAARGRARPFDAMEGAPELVNRMVSAGLIEKIDAANVPNMKPLPAIAVKPYAVTTFALLDVVVYNADKFKEAGIAPPTHYSDLANPKLAGRVAFPDVDHTEHLGAIVGLAYDAGGDESSIARAIPLVNKIKPAYYFAASTELATRFGSGEIWAAPWSAAWALRLKRSGLPIAVSYMQFGDTMRGCIWPNLYHIVKGTANTAAAEAFLNQYLAPDTQFSFGMAVGDLPMNPQARERMSKEASVKDILKFSDADINAMKEVDYSKIDLAAWHDRWARDITR
ncbi:MULTISPECIES: extracellular solute-binding protein [unclassified Caballeronia]|uniref:ABC transporter substrate-binding protein n=1 Tax=unclassified Caballeronia TaxID=2646786 RepID=UPI00286005FD|nr:MULTISPECIES: extracellular solute-binding protein [unclassified Caballeronia]MDR5815091.1 extracellular solute-binding protein [Caballeronia sp. LZ033]MDR5821560.1 extracellular solute-binding protein [Caballeronia sp. LZ043]MDR5879783.1 extracellular solute-binding protein [Caballeronia sp. LZ032]